MNFFLFSPSNTFVVACSGNCALCTYVANKIFGCPNVSHGEERMTAANSKIHPFHLSTLTGNGKRICGKQD